MQFRVDAEIQALTRDLQALAMDHRIVVCTNNRPYAIAMATSFAWASASHPGQLLGICTKPAEALALLPDEAQPVLAFVSEHLDDGSGLELVSQLKAHAPAAGAMATVLTLESLDAATVRRAWQGPTDALLTQRGLQVSVLVSALEALMQGLRYAGPVASHVLRDGPERSAQDLSSREHSVLELVCEGLTNREIGQHLHIAESTARGHVQAIIGKLHVRDRTAAAAEGVRRHLVD